MKLEFNFEDAINLAHTFSAIPTKQLIFDSQTAFYIAKKIIESDPSYNIISEGDFWWTIDGENIDCDDFPKCDYQITFSTT